MNLAVWALLALLAFATYLIGINYGKWAATFFVIGWAGSTCMWQLGHYLRYGHFYRYPVIKLPEGTVASSSNR